MIKARGRRDQRIVSAAEVEEDRRSDANVRPESLSQYIGQKRVKENIAMAIEAAQLRGDALDHVLLYGPPGLGKTTLARIIANELHATIKISAGPLLDRKGDLTAILTSLDSKAVFFLDEIQGGFSFSTQRAPDQSRTGVQQWLQKKLSIAPLVRNSTLRQEILVIPS